MHARRCVAGAPCVSAADDHDQYEHREGEPGKTMRQKSHVRVVHAVRDVAGKGGSRSQRGFFMTVFQFLCFVNVTVS